AYDLRARHSFPPRRSSALAPARGRGRAPDVLFPDDTEPSTPRVKLVERGLDLPHAMLLPRDGPRVAPTCRSRDSGNESGSLPRRSEEHTSELQSRENLVCR